MYIIKIVTKIIKINLNKSWLDWTAKDEDGDDISVWEDNWDDDDVEDDFNQQLRYRLAMNP